MKSIRRLAFLSVIAWVVALLIVPVSEASLTSSILLHRPYSNVRVHSILVQYQRVKAQGDADLTHLKAPYFNASDGRGGFAAKILLSGGCNSPCYNETEAEKVRARLIITIPIPTLVNATLITANWSARLNWSWNITSGGCQTAGANSPICLVESYESFEFEPARLFDWTNRSSVCAGNCSPSVSSTVAYNVSGCNSGWCNGGTQSIGSFSNLLSWSPAFHVAGMKPGHRYYLQFEFVWKTYAFEVAYGKGYLPNTVIVAYIGMAGHGNGVQLRSITVA
jgi:hypothetical protein